MAYFLSPPCFSFKNPNYYGTIDLLFLAQNEAKKWNRKKSLMTSQTCRRKLNDRC
jgi:hypothetical protein